MSNRHVDASGPPRFMLWSEVMNWSDILVLAELELILSATLNDEYRGDSDLTTTEDQLRGVETTANADNELGLKK